MKKFKNYKEADQSILLKVLTDWDFKTKETIESIGYSFEIDDA